MPEQENLSVVNATIVTEDGTERGSVTMQIVLDGDTVIEPPVNNAPVAETDSITLNQGETVNFDVMANDSDPDGDTLSIVSVTQPEVGSVTLEPDGSMTYVADADFVGQEVFTYILSDGEEEVETDVFVTVLSSAINDSPEDHEFFNNLKMASEHMPPMNMELMAEHMDSVALVPFSGITHAPVKSGRWFDPTTWFQGRIPDDNSRVCIPKDMEILYDEESDARIFSIRVSGHLKFARDLNTRLVVDTMISDHSSFVDIGTDVDPITANCEIILADNGEISLAYDPKLLSRCIMTHGKTRAFGSAKSSWSEAANHPKIGDTSIQLQNAPTNWNPGDKMVITSTHKTGFKLVKIPEISFHGWLNDIDDAEDEIVTIVDVEDGLVTFQEPLQFDHTAPIDPATGEPYNEFCAAGNISRNVVIRSENPDVAHRRGHTMFMHNPDVDVRYVEFRDLGRTDKRVPAWNVNAIINDPDMTLTPESNIQTRYSVHFHKQGVMGPIAYLTGCVVNGSNGWGYVNHSSHVMMDNNISYNVWGCHFVGEDGDERGSISNCLAVRSGGHKIGHTGLKGIGAGRHDIWRNGEGIGLSGRVLRTSNNYISGCAHGISWNVREALKDNPVDGLDVPEAFYGLTGLVGQRVTNIQSVKDNKIWCAEVALIVVKRGANQEHDLRSFIENITAIECAVAAEWTYTSKYTVKNMFAVQSRSELPYYQGKIAQEYGTNSFDIVTADSYFEGFPIGIAYGGRFPSDVTGEDLSYILSDNTFVDVATPVEDEFDTLPGMMTEMNGVTKKSIIEFIPEGPDEIHWGEDLNMQGVKVDSYGSVTRIHAKDGKGSRGTWFLSFFNQILPMILQQGLMVDPNGQHWFDLNDYFADRWDNDEQVVIRRIPAYGFTQERIAQEGIVVRPLE